MTIPDVYRSDIIRRAKEMVAAGAEIIAVGPYGCVLRDQTGTVSITATHQFWEPMITEQK